MSSESSKDMKIVGIAGPSCSGKSTLAKTLENRATRIRLDDFYKDKPYETNGAADWEHPESIDMDELYEKLTILRAGIATNIPRFNKKECRRTGTRLVKPKELIICEGFLVFYEPKVRGLFDLRIYIDIDEKEQYRRRKIRQP